MPFLHGKGTVVHLNGYSMSEYLQSIEIAGVCDTAETTTLDKNSKTYVAGKTDATLTAEGFYDGDANAVDETIEGYFGTTDNVWTYYFGGDTAGNRGVGSSTIKTGYTVSTTIDDAAKISVTGQSNVGRESLISLLAMSTISSSGSTSEHDNTSSTANGGSAYIQSTAVTGTVAVKIEDSPDNAAWSDLVSFTDVSADGIGERVEITGTIERYTRVTYTLDGGESITMQVGIHRNP